MTPQEQSTSGKEAPASNVLQFTARGAMQWRADAEMRDFFSARGIALSSTQTFTFDGRGRLVRLLDGRVVEAFGVLLPERFGSKRHRLLVGKFFFPPLAAGEILEGFSFGGVEYVRDDDAPTLKLVHYVPSPRRQCR